MPRILDAFGFGPGTGDVVELGCGYGTFTVPLARRIRGMVHAMDIDAAMTGSTASRAAAAGCANITVAQRDVLADGFGLPARSCDAVLLFNILHGEEPIRLLGAAREVLRPGGLVAVIHWRSDIRTPRGPDLGIRPGPAQLTSWAAAAGLDPDGADFLLPPWHFGSKFRTGLGAGARESPGSSAL